MKHFYSYLAGLIDADGSIYARLKKNSTHKFDFQVVTCVVIFQHKKNYQHLNTIQKKLRYGRIRERNDDMLELTFSKQRDVKTLLLSVSPYLLIKKAQAQLMLEVLKDLSGLNSAKEFMSLAKKIDKFKKLNFSSRRKNNAQMVGNHLRIKGILTP